MAASVIPRILANFPQEHLRLVFAYGSGVFQQLGHKDMSNNMIDFTFVVDNSLTWHSKNLAKNEKHYSFLRTFGAKRIAQIQQNLGAKVYFNTLVPCEDRLIKYGVISTNDLLNDLLDWESLYVAGRLHKPVNIIFKKDMPELTTALHANLQSAIHTSLLILPDTFTEEQLYVTITGLSYTGDFRMKVGEDKNKIKNIVKPNIERFRILYQDILDNDDHLYWNKSQGLFEQSLCSTSRNHHLNLLPKMLQFGIVRERNKDGHFRDAEDVLHGLAHDADCSDLVEKCVANIVMKSSVTQSLKGLLTAGIIKSVKYSVSKLKKMLKSKSKAK